ncbi:MAG TPA: hypothetical protein VF815_45810 [Myxococcaceae bacterium]|jgi:hypothetical protein
MWLENVIFKDRVIENERLELGAKDANYYLGPDLTLRRCTVVLRVPGTRLHLPGPKFIDCSFEMKQQLKNFSWYKAYVRGCRFTGRLKGCDFGHYPDPVLRHLDVGGIEDCDFSATELTGCRFVGCDVKTLRLPRWPCFTILKPYQRRAELSAVAWPGELDIMVESFSMYPETTEAVTFSAPILAKEMSTTEAAIKAVLQKLDGVEF